MSLDVSAVSRVYLDPQAQSYVVKLLWHHGGATLSGLDSSGCLRSMTLAQDGSLAQVFASPAAGVAPLSDVDTSAAQAACALAVARDGSVGLLDLREAAPAAVAQVQHFAPLSLAWACDGTSFVVGCEKQKEDAPVFVYDLRQAKEPVLVLEDAHQDDVTAARFSQCDSTRFLTGSTDGLVNCYDLRLYGQPLGVEGLEDVEPQPEDVIEHTLNTDSSVSLCRYFGPSDAYCAGFTHDEDFFLWHAKRQPDEGEELLLAVRDARAALHGSNLPTDYLVDVCYLPNSRRLYLLAGQHDGLLHLSHVGMDGITPVAPLVGGHSSTVRCSAIDSTGATLLATGGEDSVVALWRLTEVALDA